MRKKFTFFRKKLIFFRKSLSVYARNPFSFGRFSFSFGGFSFSFGRFSFSFGRNSFSGVHSSRKSSETFRNHLAANERPEADYDRCPFNFPKARSTVIANDPTELTAVGTSNGVNTLTFKGNNKSGSVVYEIWRRQGDSGQWGIIATTKKQTYEDKPVTPGQYYEYKVRAVAAKSTSNFSNSAVVYGAP